MAAALLVAAFRAPDRGEVRLLSGKAASVEVRPTSEGVELRAVAGYGLLIAEGADAELRRADGDAEIQLVPDEAYVDRLISTSISLNWRHPKRGSPAASILRYATVDPNGRSSQPALYTRVEADHGALPTLSLVLPTGALMDPDTGLMVVGNAIFHTPEKVLITEYKDPRWWKYPGNFHMRGKDWERTGLLQLMDGDGREILQTEVDVRINGQMTRAFPQHALRLGFPHPIAADLFGGSDGTGYKNLVLRSAGNDQIKAMMRDAFQHELCAGLPFEVNGHRTVVVYINGAYWGIHHLRHRMDEGEIARRYGIKKKDITILEDEARYYRGDISLIPEFERLAKRTAEWNGSDTEWADTLATKFDVDGFLYYMATQMILANMDWPAQNVKFWKYTGAPRAERPLDGRWYFIMGDSDLGYGIGATASSDMFQRVRAVDVPITSIFRGLMRNRSWRARFIVIARELATGPFSAAHSTEHLERLVALMEPEMDRHTMRWRRPGSVEAWRTEVDVMRAFAKDREREVMRRLERFEHEGK